MSAPPRSPAQRQLNALFYGIEDQSTTLAFPVGNTNSTQATPAQTPARPGVGLQGIPGVDLDPEPRGRAVDLDDGFKGH